MQEETVYHGAALPVSIIYLRTAVENSLTLLWMKNEMTAPGAWHRSSCSYIAKVKTIKWPVYVYVYGARIFTCMSHVSHLPVASQLTEKTIVRKEHTPRAGNNKLDPRVMDAGQKVTCLNCERNLQGSCPWPCFWFLSVRTLFLYTFCSSCHLRNIREIWAEWYWQFDVILKPTPFFSSSWVKQPPKFLLLIAGCIHLGS
jgi:hypothetical protein